MIPGTGWMDRSACRTADPDLFFPLTDEDEDDDWREQAACAETDPEAFFPPRGASSRPAKRICFGCPVRQECGDYALEHGERFGIWGGMSERERIAERRRRTMERAA